ncbi:3544_t:CDS:2 [Entrophospora sp. SA101]|nr:3544_t:CDS:2 [Entrophospora sp. SA101]
MPPLSKIWSHFTKLGHEATYKQERAQCNYCSHKLLAAANCCSQHLRNVPNQSENSTSSSSSTSLSQSTHLVNISIINFIDRISFAEQQEFEILFATAIFLLRTSFFIF